MHGRYLVKLVDKHKLPASLLATKHGTVITLRVRPSVKMPNVLETARLWVVVPGCDVFVSMDGGPDKPVGFPSTKEAVEDYYRNLGYRADPKVIDVKTDALDVSFVVRWNESFREWEFVQPQFRSEEHQRRPPLGLCVEGIRVTFGTPGFEQYPIIAVANARGPNSPRTNVARSGLEVTPQRDKALSAIYRVLCDHVTTEVRKLREERNYSLTWATREAKFLAGPLYARSGGEATPEDRSLLIKELSTIPALIVEEGHERKAVSASGLSSSAHIWTIDCPLFDSAESMLREVPGSSSLHALSESAFEGKLALESDPILAGYQPRHILDVAALEGREVSRIKFDREQRRVDLLWTRSGTTAKWRELREYHVFRRPTYRPDVEVDVLIGLQSVPVVAEGNLPSGVTAFGTSYFFFHSPFAKCAAHFLGLDLSVRSRSAIAWLMLSLVQGLASSKPRRFASEVLDRYVSKIGNSSSYEQEDLEGVDLKPLYSMFDEERWEVFDPQAWIRKSPEGDTPF